MELAKDAKSSKKSFCKYLSSKRKGKESMVPLVRGVEELVTQDMEKTEVLNPFFASFSLARFALRPPRSPSLLALCECKAVSTADESQVRDHLSQWDVYSRTRQAPSEGAG